MPEPVVPQTDPQNPTPPATAPVAPGDDSISLAKKNGELEAEVKRVKGEYQEYRQKADPVLETLWSDTELLRKATEAHNKRLGKTPPAPPADPQNPTPPSAPAPSSDPDTRAATISLISNDFEKKVGIDKLPEDKQKEARGKIGSMLKEMVDPKGNKTIAQVFEEVSLIKLPWYLERAHDLAFKEDNLASAREQGKNEVLAQYQGDVGSIGSVPSGSVPLDQITLTPQERKAAQNMHISDEDYLKSKKEIAATRG